jgi:hypothetical protein
VKPKTRRKGVRRAKKLSTRGRGVFINLKPIEKKWREK